MTHSQLSSLAAIQQRHQTKDGEQYASIDGLRLYRSCAPTLPMPCMYLFGIAVMVQGRKRLMAGDQVYHAKAGEFMISSADVPVISCVEQASSTEPYFGFWLDLDVQQIAQIAAEIPEPAKPKPCDLKGMCVLQLDEPLLDALKRLLQLMDDDALQAPLLPLIKQEIIVRLLAGPYGGVLRQLIAQGSPTQKIANVIHWMKVNFSQDVGVDALASKAAMSSSSFRQHFKSITGMSPLQFLKQIRLLEARQLLLSQQLDAGSTAMRVGYESPSQFSREYTRLFGLPPMRDVRRLREQVG